MCLGTHLSWKGTKTIGILTPKVSVKYSFLLKLLTLKNENEEKVHLLSTLSDVSSNECGCKIWMKREKKTKNENIRSGKLNDKSLFPAVSLRSEQNANENFSSLETIPSGKLLLLVEKFSFFLKKKKLSDHFVLAEKKTRWWKLSFKRRDFEEKSLMFYFIMRFLLFCWRNLKIRCSLKSLCDILQKFPQINYQSHIYHV